MNFLSEHRAKTLKRIQIAKAQLQKGRLVSVRYTDREGKGSNKLLLILNPRFKGKVHALDLNKFSSKMLNQLARKVGLMEIIKYKARGLRIEKIVMTSSSKAFYGAHVKNKYKDSYRQYFVEKIGALTLIDYRWDKDLLKEGEITDEN